MHETNRQNRSVFVTTVLPILSGAVIGFLAPLAFGNGNAQVSEGNDTVQSVSDKQPLQQVNYYGENGKVSQKGYTTQHDMRLDDGSVVPCVAYSLGGISCDWNKVEQTGG